METKSVFLEQWLGHCLVLIKKYKWIILGVVLIFSVVAFVELAMGRLLLGPDGMFGLWEGNIWTSEQSQRFADPYSFSHIIHGMIFYGILWLFLRKLPIRYRFLIAIAAEACWEMLENSPLIINRYRAVTISIGYVGDSVLNSLSDILMVAIGFFMAMRMRTRVIVALIIIIEVFTLIWVRDNLTLNVIMLLYPIKAIKAWQSVGHVIP